MKADSRGAGVLVVLLLGCGAAPRPVPDEPIEDLGWLVGTWQSDEVGERWSRDDGGALTGTGFALVCPETAAVTESAVGCTAPLTRVETERLAIVPSEAGLHYVATPVDQERTEFVITERSDHHLVAESPEHDFPTRIEYQLREAPRRLEIHVSSAERAFDLVLLAGDGR